MSARSFVTFENETLFKLRAHSLPTFTCSQEIFPLSPSPFICPHVADPMLVLRDTLVNKILSLTSNNSQSSRGFHHMNNDNTVIRTLVGETQGVVGALNSGTCIGGNGVSKASQRSHREVKIENWRNRT